MAFVILIFLCSSLCWFLRTLSYNVSVSKYAQELNMGRRLRRSRNIHTGLWLRTGCVTNAQVSFFERTGF